MSEAQANADMTRLSEEAASAAMRNSSAVFVNWIHVSGQIDQVRLVIGDRTDDLTFIPKGHIVMTLAKFEQFIGDGQELLAKLRRSALAGVAGGKLN